MLTNLSAFLFYMTLKNILKHKIQTIINMIVYEIKNVNLAIDDFNYMMVTKQHKSIKRNKN